MTTRFSPDTPPLRAIVQRRSRPWLPATGMLAAGATLSLLVAPLAGATPPPKASRPAATVTAPATVATAKTDTSRARAAAMVATLRVRTPRLAVQWVWTQPGPQLVGGLAAITRGATVEARARLPPCARSPARRRGYR